MYRKSVETWFAAPVKRDAKGRFTRNPKSKSVGTVKIAVRDKEGRFHGATNFKNR